MATDWMDSLPEGVGVLTADDLRAAVAKMDEVHTERMARSSRLCDEFLEKVPVHLRNHSTVAGIATIILSGEPIHPDHAAAFRTAYEELLRDNPH